MKIDGWILGSYVQRRLMDIMENLLHNTEQKKGGSVHGLLPRLSSLVDNVVC